MERNESYKTAYTVAYARFIEQYEPKEMKLFEDVFVKKFFSPYMNFLMKFNALRKMHILMYNAVAMGIFGIQICRTRYIDERLKEALANGIKQVVILGAGFDTRPYRIVNSNEVRVFEVDLQIMQDKKKAEMKKCLGELPCNVIYTPMDFNNQKLDEVLEINKLDFSEPTFFIWEGVTQYITEEAVSNTLKFIGKAAVGSSVVFTYALKSVVDGNSDIFGADALTNLFKEADQTWKFGLNPPEVSGFVKEYNLELIEDVGAAYYEENYLKPIGRKLNISPIERIAYAKRL